MLIGQINANHSANPSKPIFFENVEVLSGKDIFMRTCDVAIIGLGLMGSSALHSLSGRGADVLGFDPLIVGEARG